MISLDSLKKTVQNNGLFFTVHAQEQMAQRKITTSEVNEAILSNEVEIIEQYPDDKYSPSCLIYGITLQGKTLHIQSNHQEVIITVYQPDLEKWNQDLKTRRK